MKYFQQKTIVVPFDFSEQAINAIDVALDLAGETKNIKVFHAVLPIPTLVSVDPALPIPTSLDKDRLQDGQLRLEQILQTEKYAGIQHECIIGEPGSEIVEYANRINADLIVMPSHNKSKLDRMLLGSVAERVLRLASCPVMILRGD
jgi:nucleotide-binding universal stress UspA family protein